MIYKDLEIEKDTIVRTFSESIDPTELKWHRDDEDRAVMAVGKTDWKIQLENRLPSSLETPAFIARGEWHRLIKGTGTLTLKIVKGYE